MHDFDQSLVGKAHDMLAKAMAKEAFTPTSGIGGAPAGAPPMDPMAGGGGGAMPPAAPPMDPAMMDPAAMGGAMPPAPPPMPGDPAAGGAPPPGGEGGTPVMVTLEDLLTLFTQVAGEMGASGGGGGGEGAPNEANPDMSKALDDIMQRLESIETKMGGGAPELPPMPPIDPAAMPPMGEAMAPMMDATAAPMPPSMPVAAADGDGQVKSSGAETISAIVARLRSKR